MLRCCIVCRAEASPDIKLQCCAVCQSALYCSKDCQAEDWREHQHKQICKLLNVGHGAIQVQTKIHTSHSIARKEAFEREKHSYNKDVKQFFKLFEGSVFEGSRTAARKMWKIADGQMKSNQKLMIFNSVDLLVRSSDSEMLSWPNSPLLVMRQLVDPNVLIGNEDQPLLYHLAELADPSDYSTHKNQVILAKQLIEHGAHVNSVSTEGKTPLHIACYWGNVTNLDFVQLLLKKGADPNSQDFLGLTPLLCTTPNAPGAAKFLMSWPTTDVNLTTRSGASFLAKVKNTAECFAEIVERPDNPDRVQHQFLLKQWREIKEMLLERGAHDTGITALE